MSKIEAEFQKVLIEKFGAVKTAKEIIRKSNVSDGFDALEKAGRVRKESLKGRSYFYKVEG